MVKSFDVLSGELNLFESRVLEASAGTGKTFSIENLVTRLIVETCERKSPITLERILVVTFTKKATRELKNRIRLQLQNLRDRLTHSRELPDYLIPRSSQFPSMCKALDRALSEFDRASIFTIHGFCEASLSENGKSSCDDLLTDTDLEKVVNDFLRIKLNESKYPLGQLATISDHLQAELLKLLKKGVEIPKPPDHPPLLERFCEAMQHFCKRPIADALYGEAAYYTKLCDREGNFKSEFIESVERFSTLCSKTAWGDQELNPLELNKWLTLPLPLFDAFSPSNLSKKAKNYTPSPLLLELQKHLFPLWQEALDQNLLLQSLAYDAQQLLETYKQEEDKFTFDDLLKKMAKEIENVDFRDRVSGLYDAVIIDEFQDTDPLQWAIFKTLFLHKKLLYLVGDPKQSIYAFRQADIYTYLDAVVAIGEEHRSTLDINYRSSPPLIEALNHLFSSVDPDHFMYLPKQKISLPYRPVMSSKMAPECPVKDDKGALHFISGTQEELEGFIAQEILRLHREHQISFREWAILVRDRHQGKRFAALCTRIGIPTQNQKGKLIANSDALEIFCELLEAGIYPREKGRVKRVLSGPLYRLSYEEIASLLEDQLNEYLAEFHQLHQTLYEEGVACFVERFLHHRRPALLQKSFITSSNRWCNWASSLKINPV
jgi:exodeoxyribonuclease V beta subunit